MPLPFDTFEPSERMRPVYDALLVSFESWGGLRPAPVVSDQRTKLGPPADAEALLKVQRFIGAPPPLDLETFWQISNGLVFDSDIILFSRDRFIKENRRMRKMTSYMPFDGLFFISSFGDGDMFAVGRTREGKWLKSVLIWEHETDRRYEVADSLQEYVAKLLVWWLSAPNEE